MPSLQPIRVRRAAGLALTLMLLCSPVLAAQGVVPKAIPIPGTDISLKFGGYVKVDFIHDFDAIGDAFEFSTKTIPTGGDAADLGPRTTIHARETRVNLEVRAGDQVTAFVEGDFFGSGNAFRLRHAYGVYGRLLGGQTWSTFQDISARPLTIDFEGPDGEVFVRQAMLRWTQPVSEGAHWAVALENPTPQVAVPEGATGVVQSRVPDLATNVRVTFDRGHVQVSGLLRELRFDGQGASEDVSTAGYGVAGSLRIRTVGRDEVLANAAFGSGIGRYIEAFSGQNVDAVFGSPTSLEAIDMLGVAVGYIHHWNNSLKSGLSFSTADLSPPAAQPGSAIEQTRDARLNLIATPYPLVDIGAEVLYGRRRDVDGAFGEAWRFQFAITYHLN